MKLRLCIFLTLVILNYVSLQGSEETMSFVTAAAVDERHAVLQVQAFSMQDEDIEITNYHRIQMRNEIDNHKHKFYVHQHERDRVKSYLQDSIIQLNALGTDKEAISSALAKDKENVNATFRDIVLGTKARQCKYYHDVFRGDNTQFESLSLFKNLPYDKVVQDISKQAWCCGYSDSDYEVGARVYCCWPYPAGNNEDIAGYILSVRNNMNLEITKINTINQDSRASLMEMGITQPIVVCSIERD